MSSRIDLDRRLRIAVKHFWTKRNEQAARQVEAGRKRDAGARSAVTGGAQMDGFTHLISELLCESGVRPTDVYRKRSLELPGWYRPEKKWDVLVVSDRVLIAGIEFKSQIGPSFGNNYNNRTEEALGSATDIWAAYREGAFQPSGRPWLGYLMLLEEAESSTSPVRNREPHFHVFPDFKDASYARRYEMLLTKLVRERLYDAACLLLSSARSGLRGSYREPSAELSFAGFATSLLGSVIARKPRK